MRFERLLEPVHYSFVCIYYYLSCSFFLDKKRTKKSGTNNASTRWTSVYLFENMTCRFSSLLPSVQIICLNPVLRHRCPAVCSCQRAYNQIHFPSGKVLPSRRLYLHLIFSFTDLCIGSNLFILV